MLFEYGKFLSHTGVAGKIIRRIIPYEGNISFFSA